MLSESGTSSETRSISLECLSSLKIVTLQNSIPNQIQTYYDVNRSTVSKTKSEKSCDQRSNLNPVVTNSTGQLMTDKDVNAIKTDSWHSLSVDQAGLICPLTGVCLITRLCIVLGHSACHDHDERFHLTLYLSRNSPSTQQPVDHLLSRDDISGSSTGQEGRAIARPVAS